MLPVRTREALVRHRQRILIGLSALALVSCSSTHMATHGVSNGAARPGRCAAPPSATRTSRRRPPPATRRSSAA